MSFGTATIDRVQPLLRILTMENDGFYSVMRFFILLHELSKGEDYRELSSTATPEINTAEKQLQQLRMHVNRYVSEDIRLDDAAAILNMSRSTFARFLKLHTGMNFTDYLLDVRINMAVQELKAGEHIPDVVARCGFNSVSYFYRVFKKPKALRLPNTATTPENTRPSSDPVDPEVQHN